MNVERKLTCFLAVAEDDENAKLLVQLLHSLDVGILWLSEIPTGKIVGSSILSALRAADFVAVVAPAGPPNSSVAFEVGLAVGLGKPVLILERDLGPLVFDIGPGAFVIRLKQGAIPFSAAADVRRFLRHLQPTEVTTPSPLHIGRPEVESALEELAQTRRRTPSNFREQGLVDVVGRLFSSPDFELVREEPTGGARPDFIVWNDILVAAFGGPLIIECKYYGGGTGSVILNGRAVSEQLAVYVSKSSAGLGLLIFDHDRPSNLQVPVSDTDKVVALSIDELIDLAANGALINELSRRRSRAFRDKVNRGEAD